MANWKSSQQSHVHLLYGFCKIVYPRESLENLKWYLVISVWRVYGESYLPVLHNSVLFHYLKIHLGIICKIVIIIHLIHNVSWLMIFWSRFPSIAIIFLEGWYGETKFGSSPCLYLLPQKLLQIMSILLSFLV